MRSLTKKVACVLLAMSMLLSIACPALADNEEEPDQALVAASAGDETAEVAEPAADAAENDETAAEKEPAADIDAEVDPTTIALMEAQDYKEFLKAEGATTETEAMKKHRSLYGDVAVPLDSATGNCTTKDGDIVIAEEGYATFELPSVPDGLYQIRVEYDLPAIDEENKARTRDAECALLLDGALPYAEARDLTLSRMWRNKGGKIESDDNGNHIKPAQEQITKEERGYLTQDLKDSAGYYSYALLFDFKDVSKLTFVSLRESVVVHSITLVCPEELVSYAEYHSKHNGKNSDKLVTLDDIQGEGCVYKNDATLTPQEDRSSPMTYPSDGSKIRLNYIGGNNWSTAGQEITWEVEPKVSGNYEIRLRCRQIYSSDLYSARTLRIDGEIPFEEAADIHFTHNNGWIIYTISANGDPCEFYLEGGKKHTLSLSVTLGDLGPTLERLENSVAELNNIYRELIMVMSSTPDSDRDYELEKLIPDTLKNMKKQSKELNEIADSIKKISGSSGSALSSITKTSIQLDEFYDDPNTIASQLKYYKDNIASLSEVMTAAQARPLDIDYISVAKPGSKQPKAEKNFFQKLWYQIQLFIASFIEDYNSLAGSGSDSTTTLTVWTTLGRDQASIINELIRSDFTPNSKDLSPSHSQIGVELQVVPVDALMPSVAAGNGPDVLLNATAKLPVEYAMRGASANLREIVPEKELEKVLSRFGTKEEYEQAIYPFTYTDKTGTEGLYGLPDQYLYSVLFYRTDVLKELGIEPPTIENPWTWEDLIDVLPTLQSNNMSMLMETGDKTGADVEQYGINTYAIFLYQNGGEFYSKDRTRSALDSENAVEAFEYWTNFYTSYGLPTNFDMLSRFRTGESPLLITDFPFYNNLSVSAPELKGLWGMTLVPGTMQDNGEINLTTKGGGTAIILMKAAQDAGKGEAGWTFIDWWTSTPTQSTYAQNLESLLGTAARYATANKEAFNSLAWSKSELEVLNEEGKYAATIPETPGSYYTPRHINNAFRAVCIKENKEDAREAILKYAQIITDEITDKRKEFGFKEAKGKGE